MTSIESGSIGARRTSEISFGNGSDPSPWKDADQSCSEAGVIGILAESKTLAESGLDDPSPETAGEVDCPEVTEAVDACLGLPAAVPLEPDDVDGPARSQADANVRAGAWVGKLDRPAQASWRASGLRPRPRAINILKTVKMVSSEGHPHVLAMQSCHCARSGQERRLKEQSFGDADAAVL